MEFRNFSKLWKVLIRRSKEEMDKNERKRHRNKRGNIRAMGKPCSKECPVVD